MGNAISGGGFGRKTTDAAESTGRGGDAAADPKTAENVAMNELARDVERLKKTMDEKDRIIEQLVKTVDDVRVSSYVARTGLGIIWQSDIVTYVTFVT